jgi:hypothetical protein
MTETTTKPKADDGCGKRCRDFDEDCFGIEDKLNCWLYDPAQGVCPFLAEEGHQ